MDANSVLRIGSALQAETAGTKEQLLIPVRVIDIILDINHSEASKFGGYDAIGTIFYAEVNIKEGESLPKILRTAKPMFQFIKQYPLKNEIVLLISSPGTDIYDVSENASTYYLPNFNIWNHPHHNALPDMRYFNKEGNQAEDYELVNGGLIRTAKDKSTEIPLGEYFQEKLDIQPLLPFEGDTIIEGRFGNSIRFGGMSSGSREKTAYSTTGNVGDPITIIRNGQTIESEDNGWEHTVENVNTDHSSIYLMSNQKMPNFEVASTNWESWNAKHDELEINAEVKGEFDNITAGPIPEKIVVPDTIPEVEFDQEEYEDDYEEEDLATEEGQCTTCEPDELSIYDQLMAQDNFDEDEFYWEEYDVPLTDETIINKEEVNAIESGADNSESSDCDKGVDNQAFQELKNEGGSDGLSLPQLGSLVHVKFRETVNWAGQTYFHNTPYEQKLSIVKSNWRKSSSTMDVGHYFDNSSFNLEKTYLCIHTTAGTLREDGFPSIWRHVTKTDCDSQRPWSRGGYHWMITPSGKLQQMYADDAKCSGIGHGGIGATNANTIQLNWIGGASSTWNLTKAQATGLLMLCKIYIMRYPTMKIFGHNQVSNKSCPIFSVPHWLEKIGCPAKNRTSKTDHKSGLSGYQKGKYLTQAEQVAKWSGTWAGMSVK